MQVTSPTSPSAPTRAFAGLSTFLLGLFLPIVTWAQVPAFSKLGFGYGANTVLMLFFNPVHTLGVMVVALMASFVVLTVSIAGLRAIRLRPIPSFFIGLTLALLEIGIFIAMARFSAVKINP